MMGHGNTMGFHGMTRAVVEVAHVGLVEVGHSLFGSRSGTGGRHDEE